ncbi:APSES transcription factor StuA [Aspergillus ochraceoroseus]|uniref:APSES transcription factor StuA n=1 Tax=Aspergillus ochraceoroseus TaxID=138278 RepID=A0A0F8WZ83_9EURO|nr:APSES transcription factor StuA [Aspergillus ochraceoroseus]
MTGTLDSRLLAAVFVFLDGSSLLHDLRRLRQPKAFSRLRRSTKLATIASCIFRIACWSLCSIDFCPCNDFASVLPFNRATIYLALDLFFSFLLSITLDLVKSDVQLRVHTRGPVDIPWYNHHAAERPLLSGDKLPALSLPTASQPPLSGLAYRTSYEDGSASSTSSSARTSLSGPAPVIEARSPPSSSADLPGSAPPDYSLPPSSVAESYYPSQTQLTTSMNQTQAYMDVHSSHLSSGQPYASHAATAGALAHYPQYHQQPPVLQPTATYGPASSYSPPRHNLQPPR